MQIGSQAGRIKIQGFLLCLAGLFLACPLRGQTIRPVIAEYREKARGRLDVVNDSLFPINVVLEAKSFTVDEDGSPTFRPLDKAIRLKLSQMSFRIPPQQTYYVFYEATADIYPAWFVIYAAISGLPKQNGLNVQVELPHTVYLLQKPGLQQAEIQLGKAEFLPDSKQVNIEIANTGDRLGRVADVEVRGEGEKAVHPGFPLMPRSRRNIRLDWKTGPAPQRAIIRFSNFKVETPLQERRN